MNIRPLRPPITTFLRLPAARRVSLWLPVSPLLLLLALLILLEAALSSSLAPPPTEIWSRKPLLGYFFLTQSLAEEIESQNVLSAPQLRIARQVARLQETELERLQAASLPFVLDPALTLAQKRQRIEQMGYNRRVGEISLASQQLLSFLLPSRDYSRFTSWVESRWLIERRLHGIQSFTVESPSPHSQFLTPKSPFLDTAPQSFISSSTLPSARSYKIFATRYDSGDKYVVALPDMCLKFSNAGNRLCADDGYQINLGYFVYLSYDGETAAEVWESGPWNVDDNYWSTSRDPQPRRMFADLPAGMPEAQAAFFDGYNGGVDQYGRTVTAPFGIDLGRKVSIAIGLKPGNNDWINITYAWTESWDKAKKPKQGSSSQPANQASAPTAAPTIPPLVTATPNPDGSVIHVVQPGQAPWSIAVAYGVTLKDLYALNGLSEGAVIRPGDKLVIVPAQPTATPTPTLTPTSTLPPTPTRRPTATRQPATLTPTVTWTPAPGSAQSASTPHFDPLLLFIAGGAALGGLLLLVGRLMQRK